MFTSRIKEREPGFLKALYKDISTSLFIISKKVSLFSILLKFLGIRNGGNFFVNNIITWPAKSETYPNAHHQENGSSPVVYVQNASSVRMNDPQPRGWISKCNVELKRSDTYVQYLFKVQKRANQVCVIKSQDSGYPCETGRLWPEGSMRGAFEILVMFYFLFWDLGAWTCLVCKNSTSYTLMIWVLLIKKFKHSYMA